MTNVALTDQLTTIAALPRAGGGCAAAMKPERIDGHIRGSAGFYEHLACMALEYPPALLQEERGFWAAYYAGKGNL